MQTVIGIWILILCGPFFVVAIVVGVMKMGNTVSTVELEPTSLAVWASVLPLHQVGSLTSPLYPHPSVYVAQCSADYYTIIWKVCIFGFHVTI